ncbi:hypothetical protein J6590_054546 [Homalodisca vitripennis]|nr:hypothetical protein J6590_054546 [Homalodisca vitripennis]
MDGAVSVSQWVKGGASDKSQPGSRSVVTSGTVTVTSINVQDSQDVIKLEEKYSGYQQPTCNGVGPSVISGKCSVVVGGPDTQDDEGSASDAEVSKIDFSVYQIQTDHIREDLLFEGMSSEGRCRAGVVRSMPSPAVTRSDMSQGSYQCV